MKLISIIALLFMGGASCALGQIAGEWTNRNYDTFVRIQFIGNRTIKWVPAMMRFVECERSGEVLSCADGSTHVLVISEAGVTLDGIVLTHDAEHDSDGSDGH